MRSQAHPWCSRAFAFGCHGRRYWCRHAARLDRGRRDGRATLRRRADVRMAEVAPSCRVGSGHGTRIRFGERAAAEDGGAVNLLLDGRGRRHVTRAVRANTDAYRNGCCGTTVRRAHLPYVAGTSLGSMWSVTSMAESAAARAFAPRWSASLTRRRRCEPSCGRTSARRCPPSESRGPHL